MVYAPSSAVLCLCLLLSAIVPPLTTRAQAVLVSSGAHAFAGFANEFRNHILRV